jgi:hypothetical protein
MSLLLVTLVRHTGHDAMRPALLEAMPPMREDLLAGAATALGSELDAVRVGGGGAEASNPVAGTTAAAATVVDPLGDLLGLDMLGDAPAAGTAGGAGGGGGSGGGGGADLLSDLLGGDLTAPAAPATPVPAANGVDALADLLGGSAAVGGPVPAAAATVDPMASILGGYGAAAAVPAMPSVGMMGGMGMGGAATLTPGMMGAGWSATLPPFAAFDKGGLNITFVCSKPQPANPAVTLVVAQYRCVEDRRQQLVSL